VGDSLANVALGFRTTHSLSLDAMLHHVQAVARGLRHPLLNQPNMPPIPLLIADLPYGFAQGPLEAAVNAATTLVKEGGADGIKVEGTEEVLPLVHRLASFGMPVMAHIGLQPQRATSSSDFQLQARTATQAMSLLQSAISLQAAGAFSTVLECIPTRVGTELSKRLQLTTIGIGGGKGCDGQVLVADDMLGECTSPLHVLAGISPAQDSTASKTNVPVPSEIWPNPPRFARNFVRQVTNGSSLGAIRLAAVQAYVKAVKDGSFPADEEGYKMKKEEWAAFKTMLEEFDRSLLL
jgi:3-methyl-2-oxobutanoate hydroxymethyltransferase